MKTYCSVRFFQLCATPSDYPVYHTNSINKFKQTVCAHSEHPSIMWGHGPNVHSGTPWVCMGLLPSARQLKRWTVLIHLLGHASHALLPTLRSIASDKSASLSCHWMASEGPLSLVVVLTTPPGSWDERGTHTGPLNSSHSQCLRTWSEEQRILLGHHEQLNF